MKKTILTVALTTLLASCGGSNDDDSGAAAPGNATTPASTSTETSPSAATPATTSAESAFLAQAFQDGQNEIALSTLALQRTTNPEVSRFARMMIDEHTRTNAMITQLAQSRNITLQNLPAAEEATFTTTLSALSGTEFDRAYMEHNVAVHRTDVTLFQQKVNTGFAAANSSADTQVMDFAAATLPALKLHLAMAKEIGGMIDPRAFVVNAYQNGLGEIQLSQIALQRASSPEVRQFAQMMIDHHTAMNNDIRQVAQTKGITLPAELPPEHALTRDNLMQLAGPDFDKAYMSHNVVVHNGDVNAARAQSQSGTDTEIRALAASALPMLTTHLQEAQTIYESIQPSFLFAALQSGVAEILLSNLAMQNSTDVEVRTFAQRMINDHMRANGEVMRLAAREGIPLPQVLPAEAVLAHQQLRTLTGIEFDRAYMDINVGMHARTVALFTDRAQNETDPELRAFATTGVAELTAHLEEARRISTRLSSVGTNGAATTEGAGTGASGSSTATSDGTVASGGPPTSGATGATGGTTSTNAGAASGNASTSGTIVSGS
ncbi:MAG: hypothetical protein JWQ23_1230 [Herminiimonas sp.]|nr:hypothetical protein [Herminiimonas sp.]